MPRIDNVKRITVEDFPEEDRETVERIANNYNFFAEQVTNVLNGNIDFDNLNRSLVTIGLTVNTAGTPTIVTRFTAPRGLKGTKVVRADNLTSPTAGVTGAPFITFGSNGQGTYTLTQVRGLIPNNQYNLVVELIF